MMSNCGSRGGRKKSSPDDPPLELGLLEVRVREEEEHLGELPLPVEVWQELHRVGADHRHVLVLVRVLLPQRLNPVGDIVRHLHTDFHPQHQLVREQRRKVHYKREREREKEKKERNRERDEEERKR